MRLKNSTLLPEEYDRGYLARPISRIEDQLNNLSEGKLEAIHNATIAAPTTGTYAKGDFVRNTDPADSGTVGNKYTLFGWLCVAGGTPGTWVPGRFMTADVAPGGLTTQVQFNDAGVFGGDADFTWDKTTNILTLGSVATSPSIKTTAGAGGSAGANLAIQLGNGNGAGAGGGLSVVAGGGGATGTGGYASLDAGVGGTTSGGGGSASMYGGSATSGSGGSSIAWGGNSAAGAGGEAGLRSGSGTTAGGLVGLLGGSASSGVGGAISISAGGSGGTNTNGADIGITASDGIGTNRGGTITLQAGSKGAGSNEHGNVVTNGQASARATTATGGFLTIPSCAGTPTGVPASIPAGNVALIYDSTNNRIYIYNGAWRMIAIV